MPPETPIIDGPTHGTIGAEYTYTFNSTDEDGDSFIYYANWGDGSPIEIVYPTWPNPEVPGPGIANHSWDSRGTFIIKAYAEDEYGLIGPESQLSVTMPRAKTVSSSPLLRFLERYLFLHILLQKLTSL